MALNPQNKDMLVNLGKDLIKKEADKIKNRIEDIDASTDPKRLGDSFTECEKSLAEITSRLQQLKDLLKPDPKISN